MEEKSPENSSETSTAAVFHNDSQLENVSTNDLLESCNQEVKALSINETPNEATVNMDVSGGPDRDFNETHAGYNVQSSSMHIVDNNVSKASVVTLEVLDSTKLSDKTIPNETTISQVPPTPAGKIVGNIGRATKKVSSNSLPATPTSTKSSPSARKSVKVKCILCGKEALNNIVQDHMKTVCKNPNRFAAHKISTETYAALQKDAESIDIIIERMKDALTLCNLSENLEKRDVYAISFNEWSMSQSFDEIRSSFLDDYVMKKTGNNVNRGYWKSINEKYKKSVEDIPDSQLKEIVKQIYAMKYVGISEQGHGRIPEHSIEGLQCMLFKFTTPKAGVINMAVSDDIPVFGNITMKDIVFNCMEHKRLNYQIIMSKQLFYIAKLAEYCMTISCHPLLTAAHKLDGTKDFSLIPIDVLYSIGADLINFAVKKCEKIHFSPWQHFYDYGIAQEKAFATSLAYNGYPSSTDRKLFKIDYSHKMNDFDRRFASGGVLKDLEGVDANHTSGFPAFANLTFPKFLQHYKNTLPARIQLHVGTQTEIEEHTVLSDAPCSTITRQNLTKK